jgi:CheY-like chemotaxis protein
LILIVEDELWLSLDISEALEGEGYDVISVANADDAIKILESRNDIHTIFTDIDLPGSIDGLKLAAAVRDRWPPVNIIVTTGMRACPCRKLKLEHIGGVVRLKVAPELRGLRFGRHAR